ncbi:hypothetical protein QBC35DRAFT_33783 [Podospora australis]|uniref:Uncharacterized protein n=1 Tax=Podospora australis TaxID=1536484 RepID=A0AAN6WZU2_9PEZI|nr:hypothetical protein QBC35DRAFT_33783 [Podospora australis]
MPALFDHPGHCVGNSVSVKEDSIIPWRHISQNVACTVCLNPIFSCICGLCGYSFFTGGHLRCCSDKRRQPASHPSRPIKRRQDQFRSAGNGALLAVISTRLIVVPFSTYILPCSDRSIFHFPFHPPPS